MRAGADVTRQYSENQSKSGPQQKTSPHAAVKHASTHGNLRWKLHG